MPDAGRTVRASEITASYYLSSITVIQLTAFLRPMRRISYYLMLRMLIIKSVVHEKRENS